jgi:predicted  nucleic acid-binding Zn-ribbon protein
LQQILLQLIEIEKICAEIDVHDTKLAAFPGEHAVVANELATAEAEVAKAREHLEKEELEERRLESRMRDQEALILKFNHQSGQVSSNQAYTALQHELEAAEASKAEFETNALEHMEAIDAAKASLAIKEEKLAGLVATAPEKGSNIDGRQKVVEAERVVAVASRGKASEGIEVKTMKRFEAVRARKQPAIAVLSTTSCPECRMVLPRLRYSEINRLEEILDCSSCRRLLAPEKILGASA